MRTVELGLFLRFKREHLEKVLSGDKRMTIRWGIVRPRYAVMYVASGDAVYAEALIEGVTTMPVRDLDERLAARDGFTSLDELLSELRRLYPGLSSNDYITLIRFTIARRFDPPIPIKEFLRRSKR